MAEIEKSAADVHPGDFVVRPPIGYVVSVERITLYHPTEAAVKVNGGIYVATRTFVIDPSRGAVTA